MNLVFHPITRTPRFIEARSLLPYDPFHALLFRRFEQSLPVVEVLRIADHVVRLEDLLQQALALDERQPAQIAPVQIQQIEGVEHYGMVPGASVATELASATLMRRCSSSKLGTPRSFSAAISPSTIAVFALM